MKSGTLSVFEIMFSFTDATGAISTGNIKRLDLCTFKVLIMKRRKIAESDLCKIKP